VPKTRAPKKSNKFIIGNCELFTEVAERVGNKEQEGINGGLDEIFYALLNESYERVV